MLQKKRMLGYSKTWMLGIHLPSSSTEDVFYQLSFKVGTKHW